MYALYDINVFNFRPRKDLTMLPTPEDIRAYIAAGLPCEHLEVTGDGAHFEAVIVSASFAGKRPIARHQLVYGVLGDRMKQEIHALSMRTLTPEEFNGNR